MLIKPKLHIFILFAALFIASAILNHCSEKEKKYQPSWESLKKHETPEWFLDGKFGIYFHWGPYSVPAHKTEWYSHYMYQEGHEINKYHKKKYGTLDEFGYKDFIPMFKAENFDADAWADLFVKAGAKFAGPVAEHADGFAMWNSDLTRWDAADMGPRQDIVGKMEKAIRERGLKFITTFHHHWLYAWYPTWDDETDASNPKYEDLYGPKVPASAWDYEKPEPMPDKDFNDRWYNRVVEVVKKYQPDLIWFDSKLHIIDEQVRRNFLSYYYNKAEQWNKEVVSTYKGEDFEPQTAVLDLERGRLDSLRKIPWLTDTSIDKESWCYIENPKYKSVNTLIDNIVDRVSKNGNTLMNIGPRPDGTIPQPQKDRLLAIGDWFDVNGEAIYGTRYWKFYGEGPTKIKGGSFIDKNEVEYTANDIRFTTKDNVLYAITLAWPEEHVTIKSLNVLDPEKIESITMLGNKGELEWSMKENGLKIESPKQKPCKHAYSFKIVYNKSF